MALELPAERDLRDLAERFRQAEARIRSLVSQAAKGDRAVALAAALAILYQLRVEAVTATVYVETTYEITAQAVSKLTGKAAPSRERANDLGRSLSRKLYTGTLQVEAFSREAFSRVLEGDFDEVADDAVTSRFTRAGRRVSLGTDASMLGRTVGRSTVSRATADVLGEGGMVDISGGECPICEPLQGEQSASLEPPFHPNCNCVASPIGVSLGTFVGAMNV